jgi:hypothetical protein
VLITSLCSPSDRSESGYAWYRFWTPLETCDFSLLWNVQTGCGTIQPLIQRVLGFFPGGKVAGVWSSPLFSIYWPRLRMSWALPLLSNYAFMAWVRHLSLKQDSTVAASYKPCLQQWCKSGLSLQLWSYTRPLIETAFQVCFMSLVRWSWAICTECGSLQMLPCSHYIMWFHCVKHPTSSSCCPYWCFEHCQALRSLTRINTDTVVQWHQLHVFLGFPTSFSLLRQPFLAWDPLFRGSVNLGGKKITPLYALTSKI